MCCFGPTGGYETLSYLPHKQEFDTAELNYTVTEKELLAVVHTINKFRHYITEYQLFVHIDDSTICFLMNKPITNGKITRRLLLL